ncbi:MAG: hypothetical protein GY725_05795 [bacterium]|nr:hypothetical protein [bacterium]
MRAALLVFVLAVGCASSPPGPYTTPAEVERDTQRAEQLTRQAADLIISNPVAAEELLREALTADIFHGQAHNNLGVIFLRREEFYEAAHEFEWARKLLPGHPDPRVNLALTLDHAGRENDAFDAYETALEVAPGYLPAIQGIARLTVRTGRDDARLPTWLDEIVLAGEDESWRNWARRMASKPAIGGKR